MKSKGTFKCGTIISAEYKIYKGCLNKKGNVLSKGHNFYKIHKKWEQFGCFRNSNPMQ